MRCSTCGLLVNVCRRVNPGGHPAATHLPPALVLPARCSTCGLKVRACRAVNPAGHPTTERTPDARPF